MQHYNYKIALVMLLLSSVCVSLRRVNLGLYRSSHSVRSKIYRPSRHHPLFNSNNPSTEVDEGLAKYLEEIKTLRGSPECVDRLGTTILLNTKLFIIELILGNSFNLFLSTTENLALQYPGIELKQDLYSKFLIFKCLSSSFKDDNL